MAPPEHRFPVSELESQVHTHSVNLRERNRKLGKDFELKDCELFELVQFSCTTPTQQRENLKKGASAQMECHPFTRLFRRCGEGKKIFYVETTAWEGQHAWSRANELHTKEVETTQAQEAGTLRANTISRYLDAFWSKQ